MVVLRLAAPLQAWSGYRHAVNMKFVAPTEAIPTKSAICGLIGAALGPEDKGFGSARDLDAVGERYALHIRVDTHNAPTEDFQVLSQLPRGAHVIADRHHRLGSATNTAFPSNRDKGNFPTTVGRRDFLPHSEFIAAIETSDETAQAWIMALREPVFMPYLGRKSCAPTFPFILGIHDGDPRALFGQLPWVDRHSTHVPLRAYAVTGDYNGHQARPHDAPYSPERVDRRGQLDWAKENLR